MTAKPNPNQYAMEMSETRWTAPEVFPDLSNADIISIDLETHDPNLSAQGPGWCRNDGQVAGIAVAGQWGAARRGYYLPYGHVNGGGQLDPGRVIQWAKDTFSSSIPKVFHNAMYDIGWLSTEGIEVQGPLHDTQFAAALIDENRKSFSLDNVAKDWVGEGKDERLLAEGASEWGVDPKSGIGWMPCKFVGPYAEQDAMVTLKLWEHEEARLHEEGLWNVYQLELSLIPILIEMRRKGVRVDLDKAEVLHKTLLAREKALLKSIYDLTGYHVGIDAAASLAPAFEQQGITLPRTPTGLPSITRDWMMEMGAVHELPRLVLKCRQITKVRRDFVGKQVLEHGSSGRIHAEFHPLKGEGGGTVSGRFSSSNPNLQQVSARDEELSPLVRELFLPEENEGWFSFDYASQEPRMTLHYAQLTGQKGAEVACQQYRDNARTDYHQMVATLAKIPRKQAKDLNLGIAYGMGGAKLCHKLGLPTDWIELRNGNTVEVAGHEGKELLKAYHENAPFIQGLIDQCANLASSRGFIRTLGGRKCRFDMWESTSYGGGYALPHDEAKKKWKSVKRAKTHKALNRLIQGSSGDQIKLAMVAMWEQGIVPMITMHDELDISIPWGDTDKVDLCEKIMLECVELQVPSAVDIEYGDNWAAKTNFSEKPWKRSLANGGLSQPDNESYSGKVSSVS